MVPVHTPPPPPPDEDDDEDAESNVFRRVVDEAESDVSSECRELESASCMIPLSDGHRLSVDQPPPPLSAQSESLSRELDACRARYEAERAENRAISERAGRLEAELELRKRREANLAEDLANAETRCSRAEGEVVRLRAEVEVWRRDHSALSASLGEAYRELEAARNKLADAKKPLGNNNVGDAMMPAPAKAVFIEDVDYAQRRRSLAVHRRQQETSFGRGKPFATEDDLAGLSRRQPLEQRLMELNVEKDRLQADLTRFPDAPRTIAQRERRAKTEGRLDQLRAQAEIVKSELKRICVS